MATEIIRPNSDSTTTWGNPTYSKINEVVTQPSAGDGTYAGRTNTNSTEQQCGFPTPSNSGTCTNVTIWMYVQSVQDALDWDVRIQVNGSWTSTQSAISSTNDVWEWISLSFTVSNAMSSLGLKVGMKANGMVHGDALQMDTVYAVLTYTPASGSTYNESMSGGLLGQGTFPNQEIAFNTSSGGSLAGGAVTPSLRMTNSMSGGALAGGSSPEYKTYTESMSGGVYAHAYDYASHLMQNLLSYWPLNEASGTRFDSHGFNQLSAIGSIASTTGKLSDAASFVSSDNTYLRKAGADTNNLDGSDFTVSAWVKLDSLTNDQAQDYLGLVAKSNTGVDYCFSLHYRVAAGRFQFSIRNTAGDGYSLTSSVGSITTGVWYFLAATFNQSTNEITLTVNGTKTTNTADINANDSNNFELTIGRSFGQDKYNVSGAIDSVGLWKRVLPDADIAELYNSGSGFDYDWWRNTKEETMSGGALCGGAASHNQRMTEVMSGGLLATGEAGVSESESTEGHGGVVCAGSSPVSLSYVNAMSGGVKGGGRAGRQYICGECCSAAYIHDSFWEDDGTLLSAHLNDSSLYWSTDSSLYIDLERVFSSSTGKHFATLATAQADGTISATVGTGGIGRVSLIFRYVNSSNYWRFEFDPSANAIRLICVTAGTENLQGFSLITWDIDDNTEMIVYAKGSNITATFGSTELTASSSIFSSATTAGFMLEDVGCDLGQFCWQVPIMLINASGGLLTFGAGEINTIFAETMQGGAKLTGLVDLPPEYNEEMHGGVRLGGSSPEAAIIIVTGGAAVGGEAGVKVISRITAAGGALAGGSAPVLGSVTLAMTGGATVGGTLLLANGFAYHRTVTIPAALADLGTQPVAIWFDLPEPTEAFLFELDGNPLPYTIGSNTNNRLSVWLKVPINQTEKTIDIFAGGS